MERASAGLSKRVSVPFFFARDAIPTRCCIHAMDWTTFMSSFKKNLPYRKMTLWRSQGKWIGKYRGSLRPKSETNPEILKASGLTIELTPHHLTKMTHHAKQGSFDLSTSYWKLNILWIAPEESWALIKHFWDRHSTEHIHIHLS